MPNLFAKLTRFMAPDTAPATHTERLISAGGGFLGILLVFVVSHFSLGGHGAQWVVASMGASAVLLFAVPHGQLSQPWALVGGHVASALVGVTVYKLVPDLFVAAAFSVALAIAAMYYLRCIHPPGGATALAAVLGGPELHALGYSFVLAPVLINVGVILATAMIVNYPFRWRRYPASWMRAGRAGGKAPDVAEMGIGHTDIEYALRKLGSYVDITEDDLARIYTLAVEHAHAEKLKPSEIHLGRCYSNGHYGENWSVRQIVDESGSPDSVNGLVIYKVLAGKDRRQSGTCTRSEFARWAKYEVVRHENTWLLAAEAESAP